jgi:hypothetical protein
MWGEQPRKYQKTAASGVFPYLLSQKRIVHWPIAGQAGADPVGRARKEKHMRYYLPLREKSVQGKKGQAPSRMLPLWVWLVAIACLLLIVLALR